MASTSQRRPKGRDGALSVLDVLVKALGFAKDNCSVLPAQIVLGSAVALLNMIRVRFPLPCHDKLLTLVFLGLYGQRSRLRPTRDILRGRMSNPRRGIERETIERT